MKVERWVTGYEDSIINGHYLSISCKFRMRLEDIPLTKSGEFDIGFLRTQPCSVQQFGDQLIVETRVNINSLVNNLAVQVR